MCTRKASPALLFISCLLPALLSNGAGEVTSLFPEAAPPRPLLCACLSADGASLAASGAHTASRLVNVWRMERHGLQYESLLQALPFLRSLRWLLLTRGLRLLAIDPVYYASLHACRGGSGAWGG